jgi:hypothetical protein
MAADWMASIVMTHVIAYYPSIEFDLPTREIGDLFPVRP